LGDSNEAMMLAAAGNYYRSHRPTLGWLAYRWWPEFKAWWSYV